MNYGLWGWGKPFGKGFSKLGKGFGKFVKPFGKLGKFGVW